MAECIMFAWRSGRIQIGDALPKYALPVASGEYGDLASVAIMVCQKNPEHGYLESREIVDAGDRAVAAVRALIAFRVLVAEKLGVLHGA